MDPPPFVDLHLHAEGLGLADLETLAFFGLKAAVTCSGSAGDLHKHWDDLVTVQTRRLQAAGIRPLVALGVHPSSIPWHGVDDLLTRLPHYFDDPRVVALGELGLQEGGAREEEILARQLQLAVDLRRPVLLRTPATEKVSRTRRLLSIVRESRLSPDQVLVDHVIAETFAVVHACGHWSGFSMQPEALGPTMAAALLSKHGAERIVLTGDIGEGASDLLALPRAAEALRRAGLSTELIHRALYEGPLAFLGQS